MPLTKKDVEHIASLARLELTEEEKEKFTKELSSILDYFEQLKEVNTDKVEPTYQVTGLENVMREDKVEGCEEEVRNDSLKQFPEGVKDFLKVKGVFEESGDV